MKEEIKEAIRQSISALEREGKIEMCECLEEVLAGMDDEKSKELEILKKYSGYLNKDGIKRLTNLWNDGEKQDL